MNFTILGRNSTAGPIYTDRPSLQYTPTPESWKKPPYEPHHLNPSKSKLNVRNSLNKTNQNLSYSNHNIDNVRASCFVANPITTYQHIKKQSIMDEKNHKNAKQASDHSFELNSKESFYKCSSVTPTSMFGEDDRRKIQSSFLRGSVKEGCLTKMEDDHVVSKENRSLDEMKSQIMALTKRVFLNQEQISKLKEKKEKDKKVQTLEQEFTQFQIQMFDILKKNSIFFADFQSKIQKNANLINEIRDKVFIHSQNQELFKRLNTCETRISELNEIIRMKDQNINKTVVSLFNIQQNQIKSMIGDQVSEMRIRMDKNAVQTNEILSKLAKIEEFKQKSSKLSQYKIDSRRCHNSMVIENKEVLIIRQGETIRDSTKQHLNYQIPPKKQNDYSSKHDTPRKENRDSLADSKRQIVIKQKIYYIDCYGYLLDENKYYLLNSKNQQILIPQNLLRCLRENNMLVTTHPLSNSLLIKR